MSDQGGIQIRISADVQDALRSLTQLNDATAELALEGKGNLTSVTLALKELRAAQAEVGNTADLQKVNRAIRDLSTEAKTLKSAGLKQSFTDISTGSDKTLLSLGQQKTAFIDLGRVLTGQGFTLRSFASNFALLGPEIAIAGAAIYGLVELFSKQTDAEKRAADEAKKLATELRNLEEAAANIKSNGGVSGDAIGGTAGDLERVRALAAAIQDTTKSYSERKNALELLRETNKAYFGDLTLEAASLAGLTVKVQEYSRALVAEAITKAFVQDIAELSKKSSEAGEKVQDLRDKLAKLNAQKEDLDKAAPTPVFTVGGGQASLSQDDYLAIKVKKDIEDTTVSLSAAKEAFYAFQDAVVSKNKALDAAIANQIQFKPLVVDPHTKDELKSLVSILEEIKRIQDELQKANKEPLFKQFADSQNPIDARLIQTKIAEALTNAAKDPKTRDAYLQLANVLGQQLNKLQNPNLSSRPQGIVDVKETNIDKVQSQIEKAFGDKGLKVGIPLDVQLRIEEQYTKEQAALLKTSLEEQVKNGLPIIRFTPKIQAIIDKKEISDQLNKQLSQAISDAVKDSVKSGLATLGETIGNLFSSSGNPFQKAVKAIGNLIGEGLKSIGKTLVSAGVEMLAIKKSLQNLFSNPYAAIAVGVAAIALGTILENSVNKSGAKAFAAGGIVTGPTLGLVGEAGPEVIFPLDRLNSFVKNIQGPSNGSIEITGTNRIVGNDIVTVYSRATKYRNQVS